MYLEQPQVFMAITLKLLILFMPADLISPDNSCNYDLFSFNEQVKIGLNVEL